MQFEIPDGRNKIHHISVNKIINGVILMLNKPSKTLKTHSAMEK